MDNVEQRARLLPCPFCGAAAERINFGVGSGDNEGGSCIACTGCQASGPVEFGYKENFISNWNRRAALASQPQAPAAAVPEGWRPINEAPEGRLCVVGWLDPEYGQAPERHELDYVEDGRWVVHDERREHAEMVAQAGSRLPPVDAPYRWFIEIPAMLAAAPAPGVD